MTLSSYADGSRGFDEGQPIELDRVSSYVVSGAPVEEGQEVGEPELKGEAADFLNFLFPGLQPRANNKSPSPAFVVKVLQPEKNDPLSFIAPGITLAKIKISNVIMILEDDLVTPWMFNRLSDPNQAEPRTIAETKGDWFTSRFVDPIARREEMVDRKVFGPTLRFLNQNHRELSLEEEAKLAFDEQWNVSSSWVFDQLKSRVSSDGKATESEYFPSGQRGGADAGKRIYGSLTETERRRCFNGEMPVGYLSKATRQELYRAIFFGESRKNGMGRGSDSDLTTEFPDEENMTPDQEKLAELVAQGTLSDPTFAMPNGVQDDYRIGLTEANEPVLSVIYNVEDKSDNSSFEKYTTNSTVDAEGLGRALFEQTKPPEKYVDDQGIETVSSVISKVDPNHIQILTQRNVVIKMRISPWLSMSWSLTGTVASDPTVYSLKTLPQKFRDDIQKGYDEAEQQYKEEMQSKTEAPPVKKIPPPVFR